MIEAMNQALEALENGGLLRVKQAITALRQAIKSADNPDEPPDYVEPVTTDYHEGWEEGFKAGNALAPTKREWVGLTDDDFFVLKANNDYPFHFAKAIEAKLKERNNG
jgi:hypothetical protein